MAEVGPDGNVWVLDWYNYIVQHNPTPNGFKNGKGNAYETKLRDKRHGRIYRLVYTDAKEEATTAPKLSVDDPAGLVKALQHSNMFWRKHAQRLLVERGNTDVEAALVANLSNTEVDAIGLNVGVIHSLWTLQGLDLIKPGTKTFEAVLRTLKHPSSGVRRNALLVLPKDKSSVAAILESGLLNDSDAQVRLAAVLAISDQDTNVAAGTAIAALGRDPVTMADRWLADAVTAAAATHAVPFLQLISVVEQKTKTELPARTRSAVRIVSEHIARGRIDNESLVGLIEALQKADSVVAGEMIAGLSTGWPADHKLQLPEAVSNQLLTLLAKLPSENKAQLVQLSQRMGSDVLAEKAREIATELAMRVADGKLDVEARMAAANQAVAISPNDSSVVDALLEQITPQAPPELAKGIIEAFAASRAKEVGVKIVNRFAMLTPAARQAAVRLLMARADLIRI